MGNNTGVIMQDIKNFKLIEPSVELLEAHSTESGNVPLFLISDDGQDWYACQKNFADDTIKIMYDQDGVIHAAITEPIPERGNTFDVSAFWPVGLSVAEVSELPEGFNVDCTWIYDNGTIYQSTAIVSEKNRRLLNKRLNNAAVTGFPLLCKAGDGTATVLERGELEEIRQYANDLLKTDLNTIPPAFPAHPDLSSGKDTPETTARRLRNSFIHATDLMTIVDYSIDDQLLTSEQRQELFAIRAAFKSWPQLPDWPAIPLPALPDWIAAELQSNGYKLPVWNTSQPTD